MNDELKSSLSGPPIKFNYTCSSSDLTASTGPVVIEMLKLNLKKKPASKTHGKELQGINPEQRTTEQRLSEQRSTIPGDLNGRLRFTLFALS